MIIQRAAMREIKNSVGVQLGILCPREDDWVGSFGLIKIQRERNNNNMSKGV